MSTQTTAASGVSELMSEEYQAYLEMPFIRAENGEVVDDWAPPEIHGISEDNTYSAECALGAKYACDLIGHLKNYGDTFDGGALANVTRAIVKRGKWTGFEIGFFHAIGNYIAGGRIPVSCDFEAVEVSEAAGASGAGGEARP